jgi:phospholipid/cholesterol/gamma-HCH transport system ATP-binding protein
MAVSAHQSSLFTDEQASVVQYIDVHKRFGNKVVLDGMTLDVRRGEALALLGRSGTGKSVTLKLLIGLLRPDKGKVLVGDDDLDRMTERDLARMRRHVGMVFQGGALFDSMSVAENVAYGLREHFRFSEARIAERVRECLALVDLENVEKLEPGALSGGLR